IGVIHGVINKSGNSYSYGDIKLGVGRETAKAFLRQDKKLMAKIRKDVWNAAQEAESPPADVKAMADKTTDKLAEEKERATV
ncbi:MAG: DNA recombination/repair protein RecA, partial [candidate division Zixibacteria bacterium]|nr:DNA recombination/repair protein RecA [candidate division Zixibacteria bacterium]